MGTNRGVVAAGHPLTAEVAGEVLRAGGNAFDAVLAALATACVAEPALVSPGGGGFLLARPAGEPPRIYDFFVQTPRRRAPLDEIDLRPVHVDFGPDTQEFHIGRGTVAVPGLVAGLFAIHRDLATMPLRELMAPAVRHAAQGVAVSPFQAHLQEVLSAIHASPACQALFGSRDAPGRPMGVGERLCQPELADVLEILAVEGEALFYRGEIGRALLAELESGGQITAADLSAYRVERREPLATTYRGVQVLTNPPPASGGALVAFALALLEGEGALPPPGTPEQLDALARVMALTAEARVDAEAGDAAGLDAQRLLEPTLLALWRERLRSRAPAREGTTQVSVIDARGNLASLTASNGEGSGHVIPGTGIVLNNMLGEEDLNPGGFQRWTPDCRLTSMMAPSALLWSDGRMVATGSGGSNRIRSALLQVMSNRLDHRLAVEPAVLAPRIHWEAGRLHLEAGIDRERIASLLERYPDHLLWPQASLFFGGAHTVERAADGAVEGCGDPRRDGACRVA